MKHPLFPAVLVERADCDVIVDFSNADIITSSSISKLLKLCKLLCDCGQQVMAGSVRPRRLHRLSPVISDCKVLQYDVLQSIITGFKLQWYTFQPPARWDTFAPPFTEFIETQNIDQLSVSIRIDRWQNCSSKNGLAIQPPYNQTPKHPISLYLRKIWISIRS